MMGMTLGVSIVLRDLFTANARRVERELTSLDGRTTAASRSMARSAALVEGQFMSAARGLMMGGALLAATVIWPVEQARQFGIGLAEVQTISDKMDMSAMHDQLLRLAADFPLTLKELTGSLYQTSSAGFKDVASAMVLTRAASKFSVGTMTDMELSTKALDGAIKSFGEGAGKADSYAAKLFETVKNGKFHAAELAQYFGMFAPIAHAGGVSIDEALSTVSAMSLAGLSAEQSSQYARQIVSGIIGAKREAVKAAAAVGIDWSIGGMKNAGGLEKLLLSAYQSSIAKFGESKGLQNFKNMIAGRQALTGALALVTQSKAWAQITQNVKEADKQTDQYGRRLTALDRAVITLSQQIDYQMKLAKTSTTALGVVFGEGFSTGLLPFIRVYNSLTAAFTKLLLVAPAVKLAFNVIVGAAVSGMIVFGLAMLRGIMKGEMFQAVLLKIRATSRLAFGDSSFTMMKFVTSWVKGIGLAALAYELFQHAVSKNAFGLKDTIGKTSMLWSALSTGFGNRTKDSFLLPMEQYKELQRNGLEGAYKWGVMTFFRLQAFAKGVAAGVKAFITGFADVMVDVFMRIGNIVGHFSKPLGDAFKNLASLFTKGTIANWEDAGRSVGKIAGALGTLLLLKSSVLEMGLAFSFLLSPLRLAWRLLGAVAGAHMSAGSFVFKSLTDFSKFNPARVAVGVPILNAGYALAGVRSKIAAVAGTIWSPLNSSLSAVPGLVAGVLPKIGGMLLAGLEGMGVLLLDGVEVVMVGALGGGLLAIFAPLIIAAGVVAFLFRDKIAAGLAKVWEPVKNAFISAFEFIDDKMGHFLTRMMASVSRFWTFLKQGLGIDQTGREAPTDLTVNLAVHRLNGDKDMGVTPASLVMVARQLQWIREWQAGAGKDASLGARMEVEHAMVTDAALLKKYNYHTKDELTAKAAQATQASAAKALAEQLKQNTSATANNTGAMARHNEAPSTGLLDERKAEFGLLNRLAEEQQARARAAASTPNLFTNVGADGGPNAHEALKALGEQIVEAVKSGVTVVNTYIDGKLVHRAVASRDQAKAERSQTGFNPGVPGLIRTSAPF